MCGRPRGWKHLLKNIYWFVIINLTQNHFLMRCYFPKPGVANWDTIEWTPSFGCAAAHIAHNDHLEHARFSKWCVDAHLQRHLHKLLQNVYRNSLWEPLLHHWPVRETRSALQKVKCLVGINETSWKSTDRCLSFFVGFQGVPCLAASRSINLRFWSIWKLPWIRPREATSN